MASSRKRAPDDSGSAFRLRGKPRQSSLQTEVQVDIVYQDEVVLLSNAEVLPSVPVILNLSSKLLLVNNWATKVAW
jgi:hypothetical protein